MNLAVIQESVVRLEGIEFEGAYFNDESLESYLGRLVFFLPSVTGSHLYVTDQNRRFICIAEKSTPTQEQL